MITLLSLILKLIFKGLMIMLFLAGTKLMITGSAIFTIVGAASFIKTANYAQANLQDLISAGDHDAVVNIAADLIRFESFIEIGTILMLIFSVIILIRSFSMDAELAGAFIMLIISAAAFILRFQLSAYGSVESIAEAGLSKLIRPDNIAGMVFVIIILVLSAIEALISFIGIFMTFSGD